MRMHTCFYMKDLNIHECWCLQVLPAPHPKHLFWILRGSCTFAYLKMSEAHGPYAQFVFYLLFYLLFTERRNTLVILQVAIVRCPSVMNLVHRADNHTQNY